MGLLARWFRFQPSEIDRLSVADFTDWCRMASDQIQAEKDAQEQG